MSMIRTSGRILKSENVELEGQYHLDVAPADFTKAAPQQTEAVSVPMQARILENHPDYVVIEVTCSCGTRTVLKCEYAGAQTPENFQTQKGAGAAPSQTK